ncbi:MAG: esterase-like activity of phytase family protein [Alphaproteobacteria bacterium]
MVLATASPAAAEPLEIHSRKVALNPEDRAQSAIGALEYLGGLALSAEDSRFGGLSGLDVSADGTRMTAVTDRGHWVTARLVYDDGGRLTGVADGAIDPIRDETGRPVARPWNDAEEIARLADGTLLVSFEHRHRIWAYRDFGALVSARAQALHVPGALAAAPFNGGLEALTALADGRLLAVTEKHFKGKGAVNAWLLSAGGSREQPLSYAVDSDFRPTSLATLPDGDVLALERRFTAVAGAAARLRRIDKEAIAPGATLAGREIARLAPPLTVDNFEGLALRRDAGGAVQLYMISDDNFRPHQRTLLMHFRLRE